MATSVSSTDDEDTTRFCRLSIIIIDELTKILRDLLNNEILPTQIYNKVVERNVLGKLRPEQVDVVMNAKTRGYKDFDIGLLYTLLRNVCRNTPLPSPGTWGVSNIPSPNEVTVGDDIERIRLLRNKLIGHIPKAAISEIEFKEYLLIISGICTRMQTLLKKDYVKRLQDAEEHSIDQATEDQYLELIRKIAEEERTIKDMVQANGDMLQDIRSLMAGKNSCVKLNHYKEPHSFGIYNESHYVFLHGYSYICN